MFSAAAMAAAVVVLAPPQRAAEVAATFGVNAHIEYTDGGYRDLAHVLAALDYIGVHTVRDAAPNPSNQGQAGYAALAKAGVKFDLFVNGQNIGDAARRIAQLDHAVPGSVISIEGLNEVNNHPGFTYSGEADLHQAGAKYQADLYKQVKSTPSLANIPVVAFTDYPYTAGRSDIGNGHVYPPGDVPLWAALSSAVHDIKVQVPGQPIVFTELGFATSRGRPGVSELAQARLLLTSLLECAALGVQRTYIYQLLDAYPDPGGADQEKHFGLFDLQYAPKPSARMLHLLAPIYADRGAQARSFPPKSPELSFSGGGADLHRLVVQKSNGEIVVAVWRDVKVYDYGRSSDVPVDPVAVDVRLPARHGPVTVNDPVAATRGEVRASAVATRLSVGADPLIVQIAPDGSAAS